MLLSSGSPGTICEKKDPKVHVSLWYSQKQIGSLQTLLCWNLHNKGFGARGLRTGKTSSNLRCKILN